AFWIDLNAESTASWFMPPIAPSTEDGPGSTGCCLGGSGATTLGGGGGGALPQARTSTASGRITKRGHRGTSGILSVARPGVILFCVPLAAHSRVALQRHLCDAVVLAARQRRGVRGLSPGEQKTSTTAPRSGVRKHIRTKFRCSSARMAATRM